MKSLRKGIEDYDRRRGWRGPIANKIKNKNWNNIVSRYKLDPTLNWNIAEIVSTSDQGIKFQIINDKSKQITEDLSFKNLKWSIRKKNP